jgi:hypothetical protein
MYDPLLPYEMVGIVYGITFQLNSIPGEQQRYILTQVLSLLQDLIHEAAPSHGQDHWVADRNINLDGFSSILRYAASLVKQVSGICSSGGKRRSLFRKRRGLREWCSRCPDRGTAPTPFSLK